MSDIDPILLKIDEQDELNKKLGITLSMLIALSTLNATSDLKGMDKDHIGWILFAAKNGLEKARRVIGA